MGKCLIFWKSAYVYEFHSVAAKDTSCTIRLLAKFELPARASNKIRLYPSSEKMYTIMLVPDKA